MIGDPVDAEDAFIQSSYASLGVDPDTLYTPEEWTDFVDGLYPTVGGVGEHIQTNHAGYNPNPTFWGGAGWVGWLGWPADTTRESRFVRALREGTS